MKTTSVMSFTILPVLLTLSHLLQPRRGHRMEEYEYSKKV